LEEEEEELRGRGVESGKEGKELGQCHRRHLEEKELHH
jgi:hypothetical protein